METGKHWVEKVVPPILIGVVLWEFIRLRIRRQNEPHGTLKGFYLETTIFGKRSIHVIPFYIKNYRLCWGSSVDKFPLTKLPSVAFRHILSIMPPKEQVQLAITSKKTEKMIQMENMKISRITVNIQQEYSNIKLEHETRFGDEALTIFCNSKTYEKNPVTWPHITMMDVLPWKDKNLSPLKNTIKILRRCQSLYQKVPRLDLGINADNESTNVEEILNVPEFQNWRAIYVFGKKIEAKDLDLIMLRAREDRAIIANMMLEIPENYSHWNVFKFYNIVYDDARWITLDHLLTLRNSNQVFIGRKHLESKLRYDELNRLIKHWIKSGYHMFRELHIRQPVSRELIPDIFKGLAVVVKYKNNWPIHLIASQHFETKKFPLLTVRLHTGKVAFHTFSPDEIDPSFGTPWTREFKILKNFTEKKLIEEQLEKLEKRRLRRLRRDDYAWKVNELTEKQGKLEQELLSHPVYYENGMLVVEEIVEEPGQ